MSDDKAQQEPSMEDILASIRRILSEDDAEEAVKTAPPPAPPPKAVAPEPEPEPEPLPELDAEPEPLPEPEPSFEVEPEEDVLELTDDMVTEDEASEPKAEVEPEPFDFAPEPAFAAAEPEVEDIEEEQSLLSPPVQQASTSALAELARAVARERGVGLGNASLTLEDLTRDILKTLIKDWLDQNLPYMIERIVKKEIEKMVNRAEKL